MIAVDTSVVVAAFATWHEGHVASAAALRRRPRIPAHVLVESYSVLTRLPPPHRAPGALVVRFLAERFPEAPLALSPGAHRGLIETAASLGLTGGSIHDALIALTAARSRATLLTRDRRATAVYERVGVSYEVVA